MLGNKRVKEAVIDPPTTKTKHFIKGVTHPIAAAATSMLAMASSSSPPISQPSATSSATTSPDKKQGIIQQNEMFTIEPSIEFRLFLYSGYFDKATHLIQQRLKIRTMLAKTLCRETVRVLALLVKMANPEEMIVPLRLRLCWSRMVMDTLEYTQYCFWHFGNMLSYSTDQLSLVTPEAYERRLRVTIELYQRVYQESPIPSLWFWQIQDQECLQELNEELRIDVVGDIPAFLAIENKVSEDLTKAITSSVTGQTTTATTTGDST